MICFYSIIQSEKRLGNSLRVLILNEISMDYTACPLELCMALKIYIYLLKVCDALKVNLARAQPLDKVLAHVFFSHTLRPWTYGSRP
jgi:hypothetical protein